MNSSKLRLRLYALSARLIFFSVSTSGMALFFALLIARDHFTALARGPLRDNAVEGTSKGMLAHLSLLFVPAGVGVVQNLDLLAQRGVAIALVLAASVVVTLLVTAGTFLVINRLMVRRR